MDWKRFLTDVSITLMSGENLLPEYRDSVTTQWLGYEGATASQISKREQELQITFPPSYKQFLQTSNGFRQVGSFIWDIMPVENITWLKDFDEDFYAMYVDDIKTESLSDEKHFVYGEEQDVVRFKAEYLCNSLVISAWGDAAILLLNPAVKFGDEWEAWMYATWYPGAVRYKSFEELMKGLYKSHQDY